MVPFVPTGTLSPAPSCSAVVPTFAQMCIRDRGYAVTGTDGGALLISGNSNLVYLVTGGEGS